MPEERSSREPRGPRQRWLYLAGSVAVLALAYRLLLLPGRLLAMGDLPFFHLPLRTLFRRALEGGIPWWNGALNGGQPILSNPNYAAFYPPSWIALVVPVPVALHLILLLHAAWAFAGAWRLARHLGCRRRSAMLAATAFALGGSLVSTTSILTLFCGLSWVPWIVMWGHRVTRERAWLRPTCLLGLGLAAQLLAGEPVACLVSGIALVGLSIDTLTKRSGTTLRLAPGVALALVLASIQLVPTAARIADSPRGDGQLESRAGLRSMHPVRFTEWAVAHPLGDPGRLDEGLFFGHRLNDKGYPYIPSLYPGLLITILAIAGLARPGMPLRAVWITMLLIGAALAIGRHNPLYLEGIARLPVLSQVRYPEKYILAAMTALPFAAALEWDRLLGQPASPRRRLSVLLAAGAAALVALLALLFLALPESPAWLASSTLDNPMAPERTELVLSWARLEVLVALGVALATWLLLALGGRSRASRLAVAAVVLLAADLSWQNRHALQVAPTSSVLQPNEVVRDLPADVRIFTDLMFAAGSTVPLRHDEAGPDQYWHGLETAEPYVAALWGRSYALNHDYDLMLTRAARRALAALEEDWETPEAARRFLGAWNVGTILQHRPLPDVLRDRFEGRPGPRLEATTNPDLLPLVRAVPRVVFHGDADSALAAARREGYAFEAGEHWVQVPGQSASSPVAGAPAPDLEIEDRHWSRLELTTRDQGPQLLQIAVTFDPGWQATANGEPLAVHETATGQMGLQVPPGEHRVVVRYRDPYVWLGLVLSLVGLAVAAGLWTRGHHVQIGRLQRG